MASLQLFCALVVLALATQASSTPLKNDKTLSLGQKRIIDGHRAVDSQFIYQVSLRVGEGVDYFCGGAILNENFIVTSEGCVRRSWVNAKRIMLLRAYVGSNKMSDLSLPPYEIEQIIEEPNSRFLALLQTTTSITFIPHRIGPIALPTHDVPRDGGMEVVISGWGFTNHSEAYPDDLQYLIEVTSLCPESVTNNAIVCATEGKQGSGFNDMGSPLVSVEAMELVGVLLEDEAMYAGTPTTYVNVYRYLAWINEIMNSV